MKYDLFEKSKNSSVEMRHRLQGRKCEIRRICVNRDYLGAIVRNLTFMQEAIGHRKVSGRRLGFAIA